MYYTATSPACETLRTPTTPLLARAYLQYVVPGAMPRSPVALIKDGRENDAGQDGKEASLEIVIFRVL